MPITNTEAGQARLAAVTLLKALKAIEGAGPDLYSKNRIIRDRATTDVLRWAKAALATVAQQPADADPLAALRAALDSAKLAYVREHGGEQCRQHLQAVTAVERAISCIIGANAESGVFVAQG